METIERQEPRSESPRTLAEEVRDLSTKIQFVTPWWNDVLGAAADEMERLQREVEQLRKPARLSWRRRIKVLLTGVP